MSNASDSDDDFVLPDDFEPARRMTIEALLAHETRKMARFLDSDTEHLPLWKPTPSYDGVDTWTQSSIDRLAALHIPKTVFSPYPDLGLYSFGNPERLDPMFPSMIDDFMRGDSHIFLSNASGTGKTRLVAETLARRWGLYFTCSTGLHGSNDLAELLTSLGPQHTNGPGLVEHLPLTTRRLSRPAAAKLANNRTMTRSALDRLLLARLLILKEFRTLCEQRGISDEQARRKWVLLQLRPLESVAGDSFGSIFSSLRELSTVALRQRLTAVLLETHLEYVVVDDAHVALRMYPHAFVARNGQSQLYRHAPVLHEIAICFAESLPVSRLVVSSSEEDARLITDALLFSGAINKDIRLFYALRTLDSVETCTVYIEHFFANEVSDADCRLAYAWTRGRFQFLAVLVRFTLMFGARNFTRVLHAILFAYGDYAPSGVESLRGHFDFMGNLHPVVDFRDLNESPSRMDLRRAVMMFLSAAADHGETPDENSVAIVSLGAGVYRDLEDGQRTVAVSEPLILLRLAYWVRTSTEGGIHAVIRQKLEDDTFDISAACFCYGLPTVLWDVLISNPGVLEGWLEFPGLRPSWTRHSASIALPRFRQRRRPFLSLHDRPASLLQIADTPSDVFEWLNNAETPFLIPDDDFGAELVFMLDLHGGAQVLVLVHTQFSAMKRTRRDMRVVPTRPDELYKNSPENNQKLMDILAKLPTLPLGSRKRARGSDTTKERYAHLPLLRLLCFTQPWRVDKAYDPPVASVNFRRLLQLPPPEEMKLADVEKRILNSV